MWARAEIPFPTAWTDRPGDEKTDEFQAELDGLVEALRSDGQYGGVLQGRAAMGRYCSDRPEGGFNDGFEFAFRADTARYSYLIRLNPYKSEENLFIYCYRRDWLDRHMKHAEKGIRFITPGYKEKFRIEDGDMVRIRRFDGAVLDRVCRYIDEYHVEIGGGRGDLYHICQFAELMERNGNSVIPPALHPAGQVLQYHIRSRRDRHHHQGRDGPPSRWCPRRRGNGP